MTSQKHSGFGVAVLAFMIAVAISLGFYQFVYFPIVSAKPQIPKEVREPELTTEIKIIKGSVDQNQQDNFIPKLVEVQLGLDNRVKWTNEDETGHTVTSDDDAVDKYTGPFDSLKTKGVGTIMTGESFEFLFTQIGEFKYHCEPHPYMTGTIKVIKQKF